MSWNGSGTFNRLFSWVSDKTAGLDISSSRMDTDTDDITSNGFGNCLTRDGQGSASANLPMNTFRHTGVGNGVARTDYAALGQVEDGKINWAVAGGSADALTVTLSPAVTALVDGQLIFARAAHANATTTPTLAVNGLTAETITRDGGNALLAGDIVDAGYECIFRYNLANTRFELLNPAIVVNIGLQPVNAWTIKGNPTSSSDNPTDFTIDSLTLKATPDPADEYPIWDVAGSAMKKVTLLVTAGTFANSGMGYAIGMLNGTLSATVGSSALTIAIKTLAGSDPSSSSPVIFLVPTGSGGWSVISLTAALSVTVPATATVATVSGQASRLWVAVFNNSGTPVLGVYNSLNSSAPSIVSWNETLAASGTGISTGSSSAATWYTASSVTSKNFRVLGYVESTQATAGTWATSPSNVTLFGPGVKKPGDMIQQIDLAISGANTTGSSTFVALSGDEISITPTSAANLIRVGAAGSLTNTGLETMDTVMSRGTTAATNLFGAHGLYTAQSNGLWGYVHPFGSDLPNTTSSQTYAVQAKTAGGTLTFGGTGTVLMTAAEIQI